MCQNFLVISSVIFLFALFWCVIFFSVALCFMFFAVSRANWPSLSLRLYIYTCTHTETHLHTYMHVIHIYICIYIRRLFGHTCLTLLSGQRLLQLLLFSLPLSLSISLVHTHRETVALESF